MKKLSIVVIMLMLASSMFAQNIKFDVFAQKVSQQFEDRGYKLVSGKIGKIADTLPLVSDTLMLEAENYYNIVAISDNCSYCVLKLFYVDEETNMHPLDFEVEETVDDRFNYRIYKNMCRSYEVGRYVLFISSEIPYDMGLLVYKKRLP